MLLYSSIYWPNSSSSDWFYTNCFQLPCFLCNIFLFRQISPIIPMIMTRYASTKRPPEYAVNQIHTITQMDFFLFSLCRHNNHYLSVPISICNCVFYRIYCICSWYWECNHHLYWASCKEHGIPRIDKRRQLSWNLDGAHRTGYYRCEGGYIHHKTFKFMVALTG